MIRQYSLLTGSYSFPLLVNGRVVSPAKTDPAIQWLIADRDHHAPHPSRMQASDSGLVLTYPMNQLRSVSHSTCPYQSLPKALHHSNACNLESTVFCCVSCFSRRLSSSLLTSSSPLLLSSLLLLYTLEIITTEGKGSREEKSIIHDNPPSRKIREGITGWCSTATPISLARSSDRDFLEI